MKYKLLFFLFLINLFYVNFYCIDDDQQLSDALDPNQGGIDEILRFLNEGEDVDRKLWNHPLLACAVSTGKIDIVEMLIMRGANVDLTGESDWSPLHVASYWEIVETIRLLLRQKANINLEDTNGQIPLYLAVKKDNSEVVKIFREYMPDINKDKLIKFIQSHNLNVSVEIKQLLGLEY